MINGKRVIEIINKIYEKIEKNKAYLTELDATIGDGDHGLNMSRGFSAVVLKLKDESTDNLGDIFKKAGMALVSNVGGASGPLYGTAFMKGAVVVNGKSEMDINDFLNLLKSALDGIKQRGKGVEGEKTMIDSLSPAIEELEKAINEGLSPKEALEKAKDGALKGVEYTKTIVAKKGRASYLGERSIGHQDAGATSCYYILETVWEEV